MWITHLTGNLTSYTLELLQANNRTMAKLAILSDSELVARARMSLLDNNDKEAYEEFASELQNRGYAFTLTDILGVWDDFGHEALPSFE